MIDDGLWIRAVQRQTIGIFRLSADGAILEANDALGEFLGVPTVELIGRSLDSLGHPDDGERVRRRRDERIASGRTLDHYVLEFRSPAGPMRVAEVVALDLAGADGEIETIGLVHDATGASRLEETLRRERELISAVCERVRDGVVIVDGEGKVVFANIAAAAMFRQEKPLLGQAFDELVEVPAALGAVRPGSWLHDAPTGDAGFRLVRPDGTRTPVEIRHLRLGLRGGDVVAVLSDRTEIDDALREAEAYLDILFRHAIEGVFVVSRDDGRLAFVNEAACRLAGSDVAGMLGKSFLDCLEATSKAELLGQMERFDRGQSATMELVVAGISGTERRPVLMNIVPIDLRGKACLLGACHDLTEIDQLRRENALLRERLGEAN